MGVSRHWTPLAVMSIVVWGFTGPLFGYSDTLAARDQHRHDHHHLPDGVRDPEHPNELIRVTQKARNVLFDLEELDDTTLDRLRKDYGELARKANSQTRTPIRAKEVPERAAGATSRKSKPSDD